MITFKGFLLKKNLSKMSSYVFVLVNTCNYIHHRNFNKYFSCHSGFLQQAVASCTDTEYSLLLNGTDRELRTVNFNLLNSTHACRERVGIPNQCQGKCVAIMTVLEY